MLRRFTLGTYIILAAFFFRKLLHTSISPAFAFDAELGVMLSD